MKIIYTFITISLFFASFNCVFAQNEGIPENLDQIKEMGTKVQENIYPEVKKVLEEEALPLWGKMWTWTKNTIWPWINSFIKPRIEQEFEKEKEELKKEIPELKKSLWKRFKDIIEI